MDIQAARKGPHLSASSVTTYLDCGLLYKFSKIDHIQPEYVADALEFGTVIHKVLAEYYQSRMTNDRLTLKQIHELFETHWKQTAQNRDDIQYKEGKNFETLLSEGRELLTAYYHKLPDDEYKVIAIEEPFVFYLPELTVPIIGFIDLMEEDDSGTIIITDWKTAGRAYSTDEIDGNFQLTLYQIAQEKIASKKDILLRLDCLIKTKQPKFEQYYTVRNDSDKKRVIKTIIEVWRGIEKEVFIPNSFGNWKCSGCAYRSHCEEWFGR